VCVCVCVCARSRERERERETYSRMTVLMKTDSSVAYMNVPEMACLLAPCY
jgi:hypothetical protein